jgi:hypothetical protein
MSKRHPVQQSFERRWPPFFACIAGPAPDDFCRGCGRHGDSTRSRIPAAITFVTAWDEAEYMCAEIRIVWRNTGRKSQAHDLSPIIDIQGIR